MTPYKVSDSNPAGSKCITSHVTNAMLPLRTIKILHVPHLKTQSRCIAGLYRLLHTRHLGYRIWLTLSSPLTITCHSYLPQPKTGPGIAGGPENGTGDNDPRFSPVGMSDPRLRSSDATCHLRLCSDLHIPRFPMVPLPLHPQV